jgi:hypothetical protein
MGERIVPMPVTVEAFGLKEMAVRFSESPGIKGRFIQGNMRVLGGRIQWIMRRSLKEHHYTGELEESVEYDATESQVEIGPTKKYKGGYDAGRILSTGTGPIPNLPFEPIKRWAEYRGIPAGPVWMSIREHGIKSHPFIEKVMMRGDFRVALEHSDTTWYMTSSELSHVRRTLMMRHGMSRRGCIGTVRCGWVTRRRWMESSRSSMRFLRPFLFAERVAR